VLRDIRLCVVNAGRRLRSVLRIRDHPGGVEIWAGATDPGAGYRAVNGATVDAVKSMVQLCWRCAGYVSIWACGVDADCRGRLLAGEAGQAGELFDADGSRFLLAFLIPVLMHTLGT